jgi:hypothetical protein
MLTALSKAEGLRYASSFVTAAYFSVRLIPQELRALHLDLFSLPSDFILKKKRSERTEEAEEKLKEGLRRIFEATKELSKEVIEGFKEGYGGGKKDK